MKGSILLYTGSIILILGGIYHIIITKEILNFFGPQIAIDTDKERILRMEWVAEGLALCFIGILVGYLAFIKGTSGVSLIVYRASAIVLVLMAAWTGLTGTRTSIIQLKFCPLYKILVAILYVIGSVL